MRAEYKILYLILFLTKNLSIIHRDRATSCRLQLSKFIVKVSPICRFFYFLISSPSLSILKICLFFRIETNSWTLSMSPFYACFCWDSRLHTPYAMYIKIISLFIWNIAIILNGRQLKWLHLKYSVIRRSRVRAISRFLPIYWISYILTALNLVTAKGAAKFAVDARF